MVISIVSSCRHFWRLTRFFAEKIWIRFLHFCKTHQIYFKTLVLLKNDKQFSWKYVQQSKFALRHSNSKEENLMSFFKQKIIKQVFSLKISKTSIVIIYEHWSLSFLSTMFCTLQKWFILCFPLIIRFYQIAPLQGIWSEWRRIY